MFFLPISTISHAALFISDAPKADTYDQIICFKKQLALGEDAAI